MFNKGLLVLAPPLFLVNLQIWNVAHSISWIQYLDKCVIFREKNLTWITLSKTKLYYARGWSSNPATPLWEKTSRLLNIIERSSILNVWQDSEYNCFCSTQSLHYGAYKKEVVCLFITFVEKLYLFLLKLSKYS